MHELENVETQPFLEGFMKKLPGKYGYLGDLAGSSYQVWHLWAEGVRKAGSFDRMKVDRGARRRHLIRRA